MSQDFESRYRVLRCTAVEGGVRTHHAVETATERAVMVHVMDAATSDDVARLRAAVDRLQPANRAHVLGMEPVASGFAVVTDAVPGLLSLPAWLATHSADSSTSSATATVHLIQQGEDADTRRPTPEARRASGADAIPTSPAPDAPAPETAGEFTRAFVLGHVAAPERAPDRPPPAPRDTPPPAPGVGAVPASAEPGDFTRAFATLGAARPSERPPVEPSAAPPAAPPAIDPGSADAEGFTRAFGTPVLTPQPDGAPSPLTARAPDSPPAPQREPDAAWSLSAEPAPPSPMMQRPAARPPAPMAGDAASATGAHGIQPPFPAAPFGGTDRAGVEPPSPLVVPQPSTPSPMTPAAAPPPAPAWPPPPAVLPGHPPPMPASAVPPAFPGIGGSPIGQSPLPQPPGFGGMGARGPGMPAPLGAPSAVESPYTRELRQRAMPRAVPRPTAPTPAVAVAAVSARRVPTGLIVVLNVVVLLATTLVLYFAYVRPRTRVVPADQPVSAPAPAAGTPVAPAAPR